MRIGLLIVFRLYVEGRDEIRGKGGMYLFSEFYE